MNSKTKWYPVKERLPESGEQVITYYWEEYDENEGYPTCVICTYHKAGDILENEMPYKERLNQMAKKASAVERLFTLLFETRNVPAEQDGFYIYDVGPDGYGEWRKHADIITHWMPLTPPENG